MVLGWRKLSALFRLTAHRIADRNAAVTDGALLDNVRLGQKQTCAVH